MSNHAQLQKCVLNQEPSCLHLPLWKGLHLPRILLPWRIFHLIIGGSWWWYLGNRLVTSSLASTHSRIFLGAREGLSRTLVTSACIMLALDSPRHPPGSERKGPDEWLKPIGQIVLRAFFLGERVFPLLSGPSLSRDLHQEQLGNSRSPQVMSPRPSNRPGQQPWYGSQ